MKKKRIGMLQSIAAWILAAAICMAAVVHVLAAGDPIYGTETNPAQAAITKKLTMPELTLTPNAGFTFTFVPISVDDQTTAADLAAMPSITPVVLSFTASDTGTLSANTKTIIKQSDDVLLGVAFPHAGVYVYEVAETQNVDYTPGANETYGFSPAKYTLTIYVKNGVNGLYAAAVATAVVIADGSAGTADPGDKVDPTPKPGDPNITGEYSQMIFTNTYFKTAGGENPGNPDNHVLAISKKVEGDYGDRTKYFEFDIVMLLPAGVSSANPYKGYVLDASNQIVTSTDHASVILTDAYGDYIAFTPGISQEVRLKHDQKLVFTLMHIGASYEAVERAAEHYTASVEVVVDGAGAVKIPNPSENLALSSDTRLIGENPNSAAFTNTYRTITPTGVAVSNLPFIMVLALAAGGLMVLAAVKSYGRHSRK